MERCALSNGDWIRAAANAIAFSRTGHAADRGGGLTDTHRSDQAWRQLAEVLQHFWATDAFADHNRARNMPLEIQTSQYRDQSC